MAIVVYTSIEGDSGDIAFEVAGALLCISGLIACLCPIVLYRSSYSSLNYEKIISEKLKEIEAEENKTNLAKRVYHITWKIQKNFYWIELHINRVLLENNLPRELPWSNKILCFLNVHKVILHLFLHMEIQQLLPRHWKWSSRRKKRLCSVRTSRHLYENDFLEILLIMHEDLHFEKQGLQHVYWNSLSLMRL